MGTISQLLEKQMTEESDSHLGLNAQHVLVALRGPVLGASSQPGVLNQGGGGYIFGP
jgi:hypothetical protein